MRFTSPIPLNPFIFWHVPIRAEQRNPGEYAILTSVCITAKTPLYVEHYKPALNVPTFFQIGLIGLRNYPSKGGLQVGHMFYTDQNFRCSGSSILAFSKVQQEGVDTGDVKVRSSLVMKDSTFFVYHAPNLATLISNPKTASRLHEAITSL